MKDGEEFRRSVYEKRDLYLKKSKIRNQRVALSCLSFAVICMACIFSQGFINSLPMMSGTSEITNDEGFSSECLTTQSEMLSGSGEPRSYSSVIADFSSIGELGGIVIFSGSSSFEIADEEFLCAFSEAFMDSEILSGILPEGPAYEATVTVDGIEEAGFLFKDGFFIFRGRLVDLNSIDAGIVSKALSKLE